MLDYRKNLAGFLLRGVQAGNAASLLFSIQTPLFVIQIFIFSAQALAQNNDWYKAIAAVEKASDSYIEYATRKTGQSMEMMIGKIGLSLDLERHRCAILGRMLGKIDTVATLEQLEYPPLDDDLDPHVAAEFGSSLGNWVWEAEKAINAPEELRINVWNLDCAGHFGIPGSEWIANPSPDALFSVNGDALEVYGDIDDGFHERFLAALDANPNIKTVYLGSGGGSVRDAIFAGREIRKRALDTSLQGNCYSACPLVFAGGAQRVVWANVRHNFGFHRLSISDGTVLPDDHTAYSLIADYLTDMGVDAGIYIGWMQSADPSSLYTPELNMLCEPNLATFVQRICSGGNKF